MHGFASRVGKGTGLGKQLGTCRTGTLNGLNYEQQTHDELTYSNRISTSFLTNEVRKRCSFLLGASLATKRFKLSQNQLFAAILIELTESLGDHLSTERLIDAANQLTKLIEKDFGLTKVVGRAYRANYFSHETFAAIQTKGWQILAEEFGIEHLDEEVLNPHFLRDRLRDLGVVSD